MKHKAVKQNKFYKVNEGKIVRTRRNCPRCGESIFMAEHKDRYYCGTCRYTEWKKTNKSA